MICHWKNGDCRKEDLDVLNKMDTPEMLNYCRNCILNRILRELRAFRATT